MVGKILVYYEDNANGIIESEDKKLYYFSLSEWRSKRALPRNDLAVMFQPGLQKARNISAE